VSCEKQNEEFLNISFTPTEQYEIRSSGEIISFSIKVSSNSELSELVIVQIVNNSIIDTMYHKQISGLEKTEPYIYTCPNISSLDTSDIKLIFSCSNTKGDINERAKVFSVISEDIFLTETTGLAMYSANNSSEYDAYDLLIPKSVPSSDSTAHIYDTTDSLSTTLSRRWETYMGIEFAKSNDFEYALATTQSSQNHYNSLETKAFVDNIEADDIIFTKIENNVIVIKVTSVIDEAGSDNDKYLFNIKQ